MGTSLGPLFPFFSVYFSFSFLNLLFFHFLFSFCLKKKFLLFFSFLLYFFQICFIAGFSIRV